MQQLYGAQIYILVEAVAYLEQQPPEGDMVGHAGIADRAEIDGVEARKDLDAVFRHHPPGLEVIFAAPWEICIIKDKAALLGRAVKDLYALGQHLGADAVAADNGYLICFHRGALLFSVVSQ